MTRDYSQFLTPGDAPKPELSPLAKLGWHSFFAQQSDVDELAQMPPVRVTQVHRSGLIAVGEDAEFSIPPNANATVGDWMLYDAVKPHESRILVRKSLIKRRAPGHDRSEQLIAANIDTAFIVSSCNADFNMARLERYIALAFEAEVDPVVVLTKADLSDDAAEYTAQAQTISDLVPVILLNAIGAEPRVKLAQWCKPGKTVAFLGSSGVGKSTLTNALSDDLAIETKAIREDDARGRHTTRHRHLHFLPNGCAVLDTPGMRELQMTDASTGVEEVFEDLHAIAGQCKFNDCAHVSEPGCAIRKALAVGTIDAPRLARWQKLQAEEAANTTALARRKKDKQLGKMIKSIQKHHNQE